MMLSVHVKKEEVDGENLVVVLLATLAMISYN